MSKKSLGVIAGILLGAFLVGSALAHPPSEIVARFDPATHLLEVRILHGVAAAKGDHYIAEVQVFRNGEAIIIQHMASQFSPQEQKVQYLIVDAQPGDTLTIYARCNKFGDKKVTLVLE